MLSKKILAIRHLALAMHANGGGISVDVIICSAYQISFDEQQQRSEI